MNKGHQVILFYFVLFFEVKAGFIEDVSIYMERERYVLSVQETQKGKQHKPCFCLESGVFINNCGLVLDPLRHPGTCQNKDKCPL